MRVTYRMIELNWLLLLRNKAKFIYSLRVRIYLIILQVQYSVAR